MNNIIKKKFLNRFIIFIILFSICFQNLLFNKKIVGATDDITWAIDEYYNNTYLRVVSIKDDEIILRGRHNKKTSTNYYKTDGFVMTTKEYNTSGTFPSGSRNNRIYTKVDPEDDNGTTVTTLYFLSFQDIVGMAGKLGITGESIGNGTVPIYLHVVYDIYKGDNRVVNDVIGVQEMYDAPVKYRLGYTDWAQATKEKIPSYYNMRFDLSVSSTYNIEVVAVDVEGNSLAGAKNSNGDTIPKILKKQQVIFTEKFSYPIKGKDKNLTFNGVNYAYLNWHYEYTNRSPKKDINSSPSSTDEVLINSPDAMPGSVLKVYVVYDKEDTPPYYVDVIGETEDGKKLTTFVTGDEVQQSSTYKFKLTEKDKFLQDKYYYHNKWYLTYTDNKTEKLITTEIKHMEDISHTMPDAKPESTTTFHMIYGLDKPGEAPIPTPEPDPDPGWEPPTIVPPLPDYRSMAFTKVTATGKLRADKRGGEKFEITEGIPTTESLYGEVRATDYLLGYNFVKKVGLKYYPITVKKDYILKWEAATPEEALEEGQEPLQITETVTVEQVITVPRAYGYWEIKNLDYYNIQSATINNYALPDGSITITPNLSYYEVPSIIYKHSKSESYHIIPPTQASSGIRLPSKTITGGTSKPTIPKEDFTKEAYTMTGNIKVRSDRVVYNQTTVMSDEIRDTEAQDLNISPIQQCYTTINENVLYKPNQIIEATKENGDYGTTGKIVYSCKTSDVSSQNNKLSYPLRNLNNVVIHTPILCDPIIKADNNKYVQLIEPDKNAVQLVLDKDPSLSDFTVKISNTGLHSNMPGYYTRDFSKSLRDPNISYIQDINGLLRNELKFPFDVYIDKGNDGDITNDEYIKAGSWIVIGRATQRFYLPMWVEEGIYEADFRTIAVNCVGTIENSDKSKIYLTEEEKNTNRYKYVATDKAIFEVSGRMYGLTIYDLTDYPFWEEAFRVPKSSDFKKYRPDEFPNGTNKKNYSKDYYYDYTLGTNDQYGNDTGRDIKYTFPLVNGSHPYYRNQGILKTGYMVRFSLETTGTMYTGGNYISIKPSFYFVDKDGKNRTAVDLYYEESFNGKNNPLVKVGGELDKTNIKKVRTGDINFGIPKAELEQTADILKIRYGNFIWQTEPMYTFAQIRLTEAFRTFVGNNYTNIIKSLDSYKSVKDNGITEADMIKRTQRWYGTYYIPNRVHAVKKGYDVYDYSRKYGIDYSEDFWLRDGYIIVNFTIKGMDVNSKARLSYINPDNYKNNGNCSMWVMEGPPLEKQSYKGPKFKFYAGDFIIYYGNKKASDDYSGGAIY